MGATTKLASATAKHDTKRHAKFQAKLTDRHRAILASGETITCTLSAVAPDVPQPNAWFTSGLGGMVGFFIGRAVDRPKARARAMAIREHLGGSFSDFPESKNGYTVATTQLRVLVFDGRAKELVSEGPISAMSISSLDHGSGMSSIIFTDGNEHIAVTSARNENRGVEFFVGNFPSPLGAAAKPVMASAPSGAGGVFEF